jgi:hypothetical protein
MSEILNNTETTAPVAPISVDSTDVKAPVSIESIGIDIKLAMALIKNGDEQKVRDAGALLGKPSNLMDAFITKAKDEIKLSKLSDDRIEYLKGVKASFAVAIPEVDESPDNLKKLESLTDDWKSMPTFTISLERSVTKVENAPDNILYRWNIIEKFSGASAPAPKASKPKDENGNGEESKALKAPEGYTWQSYADKFIPEYVQAWKDSHDGKTKGFNARRGLGKAISDGKATLPAGYTLEQLTRSGNE